jgi:hypothetical protein
MTSVEIVPPGQGVSAWATEVGKDKRVMARTTNRRKNIADRFMAFLLHRKSIGLLENYGLAIRMRSVG